jgi:putative Mg2+ transporter-C (MgtC) family protein
MERELFILLRLIAAAILSGLIGYERERTGKDAGLRTHMLVAIGAAMFVSFTDLFAQESLPLAPAGAPGNFRVQIEPLAVVEAIVTGISFLGAGTIFVSGRGNRVRGLTTAASIWVTAAVGIAVGLERYILAIGATILILIVLHVLDKFDVGQQRSDRQPAEHSAGPQ